MPQKHKETLKSVNGFILGIDENAQRYIVDDFRHVLLLAPTGSGKGVSIILPNLLFGTESAIVHDFKMENYKLTSDWRASQGQRIFVWAPLDQKLTQRFNPLDCISTGEHEIVEDAQRIAAMLVTGTDFWGVQARSLFVGLVLYLSAHQSKSRTIGEIVRLLMGDLVQELINGLSTMPNLHPFGITILRSFIMKNIQESSGIISTLYQYLELWSNPLIDYATSASDFDISSFNQVPTTLYVGVQPGDAARLKPLMQFFYQYAFDALIRGRSNSALGVSFFLDELLSIGRIPNLSGVVTYGRGYKIKLLIVAQNRGDLKEIYGKHESKTIVFNRAYRICFATESYKTAKFISRMSAEAFSIIDLMRLPRDEAMICVENQQPIKLKKLVYYKEQDLADRVRHRP